MRSVIDFYFDFSSPYGFIGSEKIEALAARHGRSVAWHPVLLGVVFKQTGSVPLTQVPLKGDYSKRDFARSARFHGVAAFRMPTVFPISTQAPARIVVWLQRTNPELAAGALHALYRAFFVDDVDISNPDRAAAIAAQCGVDAAARTRGDRRSGDQGRAEARKRQGDRGRRVRLAVCHRRRRAVLGRRPVRASRSLAGDWRLVR